MELIKLPAPTWKLIPNSLLVLSSSISEFMSSFFASLSDSAVGAAIKHASMENSELAAMLTCQLLPSSLCNFSSRIHMSTKVEATLFINGPANTPSRIAAGCY